MDSTCRYYLNSLLFMLNFLFVAFGYSQSITVSSKRYSMPLPNAKTYDWQVEQQDSVAPENCCLYDALLASDLKKSITDELQNLGYRQNSTNPYMLVRYEVINKPKRLYDFDRQNSITKNIIIRNDNYEKSNYNVDPGTLLISFIEPNTNKIIWEGFASGLIDSQSLKKNTLLINEAVRLVLQEFSYLIDSRSLSLD